MLHYTVNQRPHWACQQYGHSGGTRRWLGVEKTGPGEVMTVENLFIYYQKWHIPEISLGSTLNIIFRPTIWTYLIEGRLIQCLKRFRFASSQIITSIVDCKFNEKTS